jgi:hypothetical protein
MDSKFRVTAESGASHEQHKKKVVFYKNNIRTSNTAFKRYNKSVYTTHGMIISHL